MLKKDARAAGAQRRLAASWGTEGCWCHLEGTIRLESAKIITAHVGYNVPQTYSSGKKDPRGLLWLCKKKMHNYEK